VAEQICAEIFGRLPGRQKGNSGWVNQYVGSPVIPQRRDMAPISECPDTLWLLVGSHFANGKIKAETTGGNFNRKHPDEVDAHLNSFKLNSILN